MRTSGGHRVNLVLILLLGLTALAACTPLSDDDGESGDHEDDLLYQVATINALEQGQLAGQLTYGELEEHGDFGVGTFTALDGEMVALDGDFYQVRTDGKAHEVDDDMLVPFAAVVFFDPDLTEPVDDSLSCQDLQARIDVILPSDSAAYAIEVEGQFSAVTTRSVPAQEQPYPSLSEAVEQQVEFDLGAVEGSLVGFRLPSYMEGANAPGYHFHFITDDRQAGGHVLSCQAGGVEVHADQLEEWHVALPED